MKKVTIVGGGLAGSEAAWQLVRRGIKVRICEMRPVKMTKAHKTGLFAELVCSNSFRGAALTNAVGLLKEELRRLGSLIMEAADASKVPAGGALAVDRNLFSAYVDEKLKSHPLITYEEGEVVSIPESSEESPVIIATGPLTSDSLSRSVASLTGSSHLAFFDAISPIVTEDSIDYSFAFKQSRYGKGGGDDYINLPLSKDEYLAFVDEINRAEKFGGHQEIESDLTSDLKPFEGCMPIEDMIMRGVDTLRHGPLKPTGLFDPKENRRPYAVVQLRQDDRSGTLWSMVGMQTRMKHSEQVRIFRMIPGLKNAEFVRLGSVHRNTFINSPKCLNGDLTFRGKKGLFFSGQITGVEGYVESTASGLVAGVNAARLINGAQTVSFPKDTAIGSLIGYVSDPERENFQPMNISFGLIESYLREIDGQKKKRGTSKDALREETSRKALRAIDELAAVIDRGVGALRDTVQIPAIT